MDASFFTQLEPLHLALLAVAACLIGIGVVKQALRFAVFGFIVVALVVVLVITMGDTAVDKARGAGRGLRETYERVKQAPENLRESLKD